MREALKSHISFAHTTWQRPQYFESSIAAVRRWSVRFGFLGFVFCWCGWVDSAQADVLDRWYAGLGVGWSYVDNLAVGDATMDLDRGTNQLSFALGRRLGDAWRVELDYAEFDRSPELLYSSSAGIEIDTDERDAVDTSSLMLNLVRDFQAGRAWRPYVGVGAGRGKLDIHYSEPEINGLFLQRPRRDIVNDGGSGFAWQIMAGLTVPLTRRLELAADFRYWHMTDVNLEDASGADFDTDHTIQSAWLHLRYHGANAGVFDAPAPRQPIERGWYLTGNLGGGFAQDEDIEDQTLVIDAFDLGTTVTVGAGYHLHPRWRVELEVSYWENDVEVMEFDKDTGEDSASGSVESYSLMLNLIHQFAPGSAIRPFIGLGGGWAWSSYDIRTAGFCRNFVCDPVEQRARLIDDDGGAIAAQAMLGVDVAISDRLSFSAAYRQLITGTTDMQRLDGIDFNSERRYITSVTAGFRYSLGR
ncbi:MAG: porin family protein [Pseudomonadales bacterium]